MTTASPTRRKGKPYNPASPVHDRRATDVVASAWVAAIEVDDPYEAGAKIVTLRNIRNDPLAALHARRSIDEAQYHAGRRFQDDFETAERGPKAIDPGKEAVDGGKLPEPITESQRRAVVRLNRANRELGADGSALTQSVLIEGFRFDQICERRGLRGERWEKYFGMRFRECLDCLAKLYGLAAVDSHSCE